MEKNPPLISFNWAKLVPCGSNFSLGWVQTGVNIS